MAPPAPINDAVAPTADLSLLVNFLSLCPDNADHHAPVYTDNTLFVAIDFEGIENACGISQIGTSILDTRGLPYAPSLGQNVIKTQQYSVAKRLKSRRLDQKTRRFFTLGEIKWITRDEIICTLVKIFQDCNTHSIFERDSSLSRFAPVSEPSKKPRNIVLVGHGLSSELWNMKMLGVRPEAHANIVAYVDTTSISHEVLGHVTILRKLVKEVGLCPKKLYHAGARPKARHFHMAGNDALYTMEAMLLLAVKDHEEAVNLPKAGWIRLTKMSITEAITLASSKSPHELGALQKRNPHHLTAQHVHAINDISAPRHQLTDPPSIASNGSGDLFQQVGTTKGTDSLAPEFLLAVARWQLRKEAYGTGTAEGAELTITELDAYEESAIGIDAYNIAICAMPLYFTLAPLWDLTSDRL